MTSTDRPTASPVTPPAPLARQPAPDAGHRAFRNALGLFPTGVAIVTASNADGWKSGVTVNSFTSVSLDPPLVSFNLAKSLQSISEWLSAESFAVNLLREGQNAVSNGFARANTDKWACADCIDGVTRNPILAAHLAVFECEKYACHEAGDHVIVIGRVVHFRTDDEAEPLLFYRGKYRQIGAPVP